jgi:hypothetical protein
MKTLLPFLALSGLLLACSPAETNPAEGTAGTPVTSSASRPVNYIVLLDLSDRLLVPGQVATDTALVGYLFARFSKKVIEKEFVIKSKDRFQVVIAPQRGVSYDPARFMDLLSVDLEAAANAPAKATAFDQFERQFTPALRQLYTAATHNRRTAADYAGTDLWRYFNDHLAAALVPDADNRLLVLTDGYLDFNDATHARCEGNRCTTTNGLLPRLRPRPDWKKSIEAGTWGLLPVGRRFENLSVAVVELNPKTPDLREAELLGTLWQKWLNEAGVRRTSVIQRFSLSQSKKELDSFLR